MYLINEITQDLKDINQDWNTGIIGIETRNTKLDLLIQRMDLIEIDMSRQPLEVLPVNLQTSYKSLELKTCLKAIDCLQLLQRTKNKRSYNVKLRGMIKNKLYFLQLYKTVTRNRWAYADRNKLKYYNMNLQIFTERVVEKASEVSTEAKATGTNKNEFYKILKGMIQE